MLETPPSLAPFRGWRIAMDHFDDYVRKKAGKLPAQVFLGSSILSEEEHLLPRLTSLKVNEKDVAFRPFGISGKGAETL